MVNIKFCCFLFPTKDFNEIVINVRRVFDSFVSRFMFYWFCYINIYLFFESFDTQIVCSVSEWQFVLCFNAIFVVIKLHCTGILCLPVEETNVTHFGAFFSFRVIRSEKCILQMKINRCLCKHVNFISSVWTVSIQKIQLSVLNWDMNFR